MKRWFAWAAAALVVMGVPTASASDEGSWKVHGGVGEGVRLESPDGNFKMQFRARAQVRATVLTPPKDSTAQPSTDASLRRARLLVTGTLVRDFDFYMQLGMSNQDMEPDLRIPLRDAYMTWTRVRDFKVRVGQMKVPFDRERQVSSSALQFPDRSIVVGELTLDRDIGAVVFANDLLGLGNRVGYQLGMFGGDGRNRFGNPYGLMFVGRMQLTPFGKFDDLHEGDLERSSLPRAAFAVAVARNFKSNRSLSTHGSVRQVSRADFAHATIDGHLKWYGFSFLAQAMLRSADQPFFRGAFESRTIREWTRSAVGAFAQAGLMITDNVEIVGRVGGFRPLSNTDPALKPAHELGGGINLYILKHNLKIQADFFHLPGEDLLEGQQQGRIQMQLYL